MFLSKISIPTRGVVLQKFRDSYQIHRTICSGFPEGKIDNILWVINDNSILVQSELEPHWKFNADIQIKQLNRKFEKGRVMKFTLRANTMKNITQVGSHGKKVGIVKEAEQKIWLNEKAKQNGFEISYLEVKKSSNISFRKGKHLITYVATDFFGSLIVNDPEKFFKCIKNGIGSGKYAGLGMLCAV